VDEADDEDDEGYDEAEQDSSLVFELRSAVFDFKVEFLSVLVPCRFGLIDKRFQRQPWLSLLKRNAFKS
jgi:hypothetical protein